MLEARLHRWPLTFHETIHWGHDSLQQSTILHEHPGCWWLITHRNGPYVCSLVIIGLTDRIDHYDPCIKCCKSSIKPLINIDHICSCWPQKNTITTVSSTISTWFFWWPFPWPGLRARCPPQRNSHQEALPAASCCPGLPDLGRWPRLPTISSWVQGLGKNNGAGISKLLGSTEYLLNICWLSISSAANTGKRNRVVVVGEKVLHQLSCLF